MESSLICVGGLASKHPVSMSGVPSGDERAGTHDPKGIGGWQRSKDGGDESSSGEHCERLLKTPRGDC